MSRNAAGTYSLPGAYNPVVAGTTITADWANFTLDDVKTALTDSLDRNGRGGMLAALKAYSGTTAVPGVAWDTEGTTGLSHPTTGQMSASVQATEVLRMTSTALRSLVPWAYGLELDQTTGTNGIAKLVWDATDGTVDLGLLGGNVVHRLGQESFLYAYNNTGSTLSKGKVVHITGSTGTKLTVGLSKADAYANNIATIGVTAEAILNNSYGFICVSGLVRDIDTSAFTAGARVYLSAATAGEITATEQAYPNNDVSVGWIGRSHVSQGTLYVKVVRTGTIGQAADATFTGLAANDIIQRNAGNTAWVNTAAPAGGFVGLTATQTLTNKTISADNNTISGIAVSSFVLSNASGNIDGAAAQKAIPTGVVVGTTDTQTLTNKTLTTPVTTGGKETRVALAAYAVDLTTGNYFTKTATGTQTFTVTNVPASGTSASFILDLTNGGSAALTWFTGTKWAGGTAPTLTASGRDVLGFFTHDGGTTWTGLVLGKDVK